MNNPLKVGITGGIGSGKTTICKIFEQVYHIPIYYADIHAKQLLQTNNSLIEQVKTTFGKDIYNADNTLNKPLLASRAFKNSHTTKALNDIVHPQVSIDFILWAKNQTDIPYVLKEAALLFESSSYIGLDQTILVTAPEALRVKRVKNRDGLQEEEIYARIRQQWNDEKKIRLADHIINNDSNHSLIYQVKAIHESLIDLRTKKKHHQL